MGDNTILNVGAGGDTIASDEIAGVKHQRIKVQYGVDGSATDVSDTNPFPIDDAGGSLTVDNPALSISGGGVEATALRVTLANDSTGLLSIDDNGGSLTVDNAETFAVQESGDALTSLQTIDNTIIVDDAAFSAGATSVDMAGFVFDDAAPDSVDEGDAGAARMSANRNIYTTFRDAAGNERGANVNAANQLEINIGAQSGDVSIDDGGNSITVDNPALSTTGGGVESGALRVTLANDSTGLLSIDDNGGSLTVDNGGTFAVQSTLQTGSNSIGTLGANSGVDIGDVDVTSIAAGSSLIGDVGLSGARTSGGTTLYKNIDVDETKDQIKGTAGQVYWIHAMNQAASKRYLKLYNATAASVTVGVTVPDLTFPLPTQGDTNGAGFTLSIPNGIAFGTAITIASTTGIADADSGAPAANDVVVMLGFA